MARSMTSFGRDSALALFTARRSRAFMAGSGSPALAATVISRESLENSFDRAESARPLRCMMFLNLECPAMVRFDRSQWNERRFYPSGVQFGTPAIRAG